jgi:alkylation response protein AidB-like acyl-CoA dehydrogenase
VSITVEDEREELRKVARSFLQSNASPTDLHRLVASESGFDQAVWRALTDLGWHALGVEEQDGGNGGSWLDLGVLLEEMGAVLLPSPYFASSVLATHAIAVTGTAEQRRAWIGAIGRGELTATVALPGRDGRWEAAASSVEVEPSGDGWRARGTVERVIDGATAGLVLVAGRTLAGPRLFAVETPRPSVFATPLQTFDPTRRMARLEFRDAPAVPLGTPSGAGGRADHAAALGRLLDLATIGLAAEQLGSAQWCLDTAVAYARNRTQHGQAIGSFQAIKHRCADVFLAIQAARSTVLHALALAADEATAPDLLSLAASVAKVTASKAATLAAAANVQIHGGIGVTWEHTAHFYLKRAKGSELLGGSVSWHRERIAAQLATVVDGPSFQESLLQPELQAEAADFRAEVRAFLAEYLPPRWEGVGALDEAERSRWLPEWRQTLADNKMICVSWPVEYGGRGRSLAEQIALLEEFTRVGAPTNLIVDTLAVNLLGPTILAIGTEEQKRERLGRIISGEQRWCQGYSEPGAGSDLASVQTSAVLRDGKWVVSGQKTWTSCAHEANWMFALVRTDRTVSKYAGLTFLLLPIDQPGVEVRPIVDLNDHHHLNEVFLTDAVTDEANVLGEVNGGWAVANALLGFERNDGAIRDALNLRDEFRRLVSLARDNDRLTDAGVRSGLVDAYVDLQAIIRGAVRGATAAMAGRAPGPESSVHKILWSEYHQRVTELSLEVYGDEALTLTGRPSATNVNTDSPRSPSSSRSWAQTYLAARAGTIYAGTSEVQRNIIAERVLQMPRSPRPGRS